MSWTCLSGGLAPPPDPRSGPQPQGRGGESGPWEQTLELRGAGASFSLASVSPTGQAERQTMGILGFWEPSLPPSCPSVLGCLPPSSLLPNKLLCLG